MTKGAPPKPAHTSRPDKIMVTKGKINIFEKTSSKKNYEIILSD